MAERLRANMIAAKKPIYQNNRRIDITAYMGPRRAGKRDFNGAYGENPRDPKEGYPSFICDDVFTLYKEAGMNFLMPEADAFYGQIITEIGYQQRRTLKKVIYILI